MYFFGLMQIFAWVAFGYYLHDHNWWAVSAFAMLSAFIGLANAFYSLGKSLNGSSNKSK